MFTFPINHFSSSHSSLITSTQPFTITIAGSATSGTATITSVDMSLSMTVFGGWTGTSTDQRDFDNDSPRLELTNATTVTAYRDTADADSVTVHGTIVTWASSAIQSIQRGTIVNTGITNTATITAVTTTNSAVLNLGSTGTQAGGLLYQTYCDLKLTDSTTVTAEKGVVTNTTTVGYEVIEFKSGVLNSNTQEVTIVVNASPQTAAISAVTLAQTMLFYGGFFTDSAQSGNSYVPYIELTGTTTVSADATSIGGSYANITVTVVEFKASDINGVDRGKISLASGNTSDTATISAVNTAKSIVNYLGLTDSAATSGNDTDQAHLTLTNSTTVTAERIGTTNTLTVSYEVIEFK